MRGERPSSYQSEDERGPGQIVSFIEAKGGLSNGAVKIDLMGSFDALKILHRGMETE